jgi:tetratricopeptide (TPR) repeat protein
MAQQRSGQTALLLLALLVGAAVPALGDYRAATDLYRSGDYAQAAAAFRALVDESPAYDYGYFMLGLCSLESREVDAALKNLQTAVDLNGERLEYRLALARAQFHKRDYASARDTLNRAERLVTLETEHRFYSNRGYAQAALKNWTAAVEDLDRADRAKPDQAAVIGRLAAGYFYLDDDERAIPALRKSCELAPRDGASHRLLSEALMRSATGEAREGMYVEALTAAEVYRELAPQDPVAVYLVGRAALGAGDLDRAETSFEQFLEQRASNCFAWVNLSRARIALEQWVEAEQSLETAIRCDADSAPAHLALAHVYEEQERLDEAVAAYQAASERWPSPELEKSIDRVRRNIQIREFNAGVAEQERLDRIKQENADKEADDLQEKVNKWIRTTRED